MLSHETRIAVIIPAFNEADNLQQLVPRIAARMDRCPVQVIVVDDGSTDATAVTALELGAMVLSSESNRGQGHALRMGYEYLRSHPEYICGVTMDADLQHRPEELEPLLTPILAEDADLVIGNRFGRTGQASASSWLRYLGNKFFSILVSRLAGTRIYDCANGYKAFNRNWLAQVKLREDQFQAAEVLLRTAMAGLRIHQVGVTVLARGAGSTKKGGDLMYGLQFARSIIRTITS